VSTLPFAFCKQSAVFLDKRMNHKSAMRCVLYKQSMILGKMMNHTNTLRMVLYKQSVAILDT
jgi:hypothetical protein